MFEKTLYGLDKNGGYKVWTISVREESGTGVISISHGKENGKMQVKTEVVSVGKQGRNPYSQAISQAEGRIKKQTDKGYRESKGDLGELPLLAMLAHDYHKQGHRITFPCFASDKFDGVRCLAKCTQIDGMRIVTLESRTGQAYSVPHIAEELQKVMVHGEVWDGEIYLHGYELQDIVSAVKRTDTQAELDKALRDLSRAESSADEWAIAAAQEALDEAVLIHNLRPRLEFHVFDIPTIEEEFQFKVASIHDLEHILGHSNFLYHVSYRIVVDEAHMLECHADAVNRGYEGLMLRNYKGRYESGKRSADLQKYKTFLDAEFKILDVVEDRQEGSRYIVQNDVNSNTFSVVMGSMGERAQALRNKDGLIGQWLTVKFQSRYKRTLIPQFPTGVCIRACDALGNPVE